MCLNGVGISRLTQWSICNRGHLGELSRSTQRGLKRDQRSCLSWNLYNGTLRGEWGHLSLNQYTLPCKQHQWHHQTAHLWGLFIWKASRTQMWPRTLMSHHRLHVCCSVFAFNYGGSRLILFCNPDFAYKNRPISPKINLCLA